MNDLTNLWKRQQVSMFLCWLQHSERLWHYTDDHKHSWKENNDKWKTRKISNYYHSRFCHQSPSRSSASRHWPRGHSRLLWLLQSSKVTGHFAPMDVGIWQLTEHSGGHHSISQDLETGRPNLLFFEKQGVQIFNFQYLCMCITNKTGCPLSKRGIQKTPKGIAG